MVPIPTYIFHITCVSNLTSILSARCLYAKNKHQEMGVDYTNIAYQNIQDRRTNTQVPCGARGSLHDYVPFYFAPRSPMLYAIYRGRVNDYPHGQESIIHLVSQAQSIQQSSCRFVFTDGHGTMRLTQFFDELNDLDKIDWDVMEAKFWNNIGEDMDRSRRRQAEFLVHQFLPWNLVTHIGVINGEVKRQVEQMLQDATHRPTVVVRPDWYYT
jgi:ssDNA thymidine ADP-ribosyltransferase, DarT